MGAIRVAWGAAGLRWRMPLHWLSACLGARGAVWAGSVAPASLAEYGAAPASHLAPFRHKKNKRN